MRITALALIALLHTVTLSAQNQPNIDDYQVLLVPVFFFGPGAHGSQWETSVSLATSQESASMPVPLLADPNVGCEAPTGEIESDLRYFPCPDYASPSGLLLYVPQTVPKEQLHVSARVRDITRAASSAGTEIPVVRESDFTAQDIVLLDIPSDARFRSNLRIYGGTMVISGTKRLMNPGGTVLLEIYDSRDLKTFPPPLVQAPLKLSAPETVLGSSHFVRPAYYSIGDLVATYPQLATVPSYTIRIRTGQPLSSPPVELSTWAFVTITNNETQEVTTVSP